jgi:hypothetical protein
MQPQGDECNNHPKRMEVFLSTVQRSSDPRTSPTSHPTPPSLLGDEMSKPYIGVTDFTTRNQVVNMAGLIPASANRRLHVGAMISYKTLNDIPTSTGWENIWLNERGLKELFVNDWSVFNVLHYADYGHERSKRAPTTIEHLLMALDRAGPHVNGLQLDMVWPAPTMIAELRYARPGIEIIQQISSKAKQEAGIKWVDKMEQYAGVVDYILLDSGMGKGIPFDSATVLYDIEISLSCGFSQNQIAVAGGLGPDTYMALLPVLDRYPNISCDAQGRLRPSGSATDPLDFDCVRQYIAGVCSLLTRKQ